jgi:hypothetical protein
MGFLKSLFGDARTLSIEKIATNIANHVPNVVENWFNMSIKSFQKQIHNESEIINHVISKDLEFFIKVYYCFCTAVYINKGKLINQRTSNSFSMNFLTRVFNNEFDRAASEMSIFHSNINNQSKIQIMFCTKISEHIFGSSDEKYINMLHFKHTYLLMAVHCSLFMNFNDIKYKERIIGTLPIQHPDYHDLKKYINSEITYWERIIT